MSTKSEIKIEIVSSQKAFDDVMFIRKRVFVEECGVAEDREFDGNDFCAAHIVAYLQKNDDKIPIGTMRIRSFGNFAKFERMAVLPHFRRTSLANDIMQYGFWCVSCLGFREVRGMCKKELLPRWEKCGFEKIEDINHYYYNGMNLISIRRELPKNPYAKIIASDPKYLNARVGHWFDDNPDFQKKSFMINSLLKQKKQNS